MCLCHFGWFDEYDVGVAERFKRNVKKIAKKSLFVKLVNTERNESLVEQSISKEFLDLSAVVRAVLKLDKDVKDEVRARIFKNMLLNIE